MNTQALVRNNYNKIFKIYSEQRHKTKNDYYLNLFNKLLKRNSTILDLGCGCGKPVSEFFLKRKHKIVGLDISIKQVELAKKNFPKESFFVRDIANLEYNEFSVDAIVSFYTIFHIARNTQEELYRKINSFMYSGGKILLTLGSFEWEGIANFHGGKMYWSQFGRKKNIKLLKNAGFNILLEEIDKNDEFKHQIVIGEKI